GEHNSPRSKSFFEGVKKFFDDLTRYPPQKPARGQARVKTRVR
ncbi:hypothetical protein, partial [Escherichia coli]